MTKYHSYLSKVTNLVTAASESDVKCIVSYWSESVDVAIYIPVSYTTSNCLMPNAFGFISNLVNIVGVYPTLVLLDDVWHVSFCLPFDAVSN